MLTRRELLGGLALLARPSRDPASIGANTAITGYGLYEAIDLLRQLGFATIEIHPMGVPQATPGKFPGFEFDMLSEEEKSRIKAALRGFRHLSTHLPYTGVDYFARDEEKARASRRKIEVALEATAYFGAETAVIHPQPGAGYTLEEAWPVMLRRFRDWGDVAAKNNIKLALETGYPRSVAEFVRLVKEVDHPRVGCTIDVGHQASYRELVARVKPEERGTPHGIKAYNDTTLEIIESLGRKIFHLHVHDIEPATWKEHRPIGTGFVDYPRLFRKLDEIGYDGLLVLEIGAPAEDMKSLLADNKRRLEDYLAAKG